jgi:hypothetical protein
MAYRPFHTGHASGFLRTFNAHIKGEFTVDLGRSFSYVFEDDDWVSKVLLTALISTIPILNIALYGWVIELIRNMLDGYENPMPAWTNFGEKFTDGLAYVVASFVYNLPIIVLSILLAIAASLSESRGAEMVAVSLACLISIVAIAYAIVANAGLFIGMVRYARNPALSAYFAVVENLRLALAHISTLLMLILMIVVVSLIIGVFGWIPCIGWLAVLALGTPVMSHLAGQAAILIVSEHKAKRADI